MSLIKDLIYLQKNKVVIDTPNAYLLSKYPGYIYVGRFAFITLEFWYDTAVVIKILSDHEPYLVHHSKHDKWFGIWVQEKLEVKHGLWDAQLEKAKLRIKEEVEKHKRGETAAQLEEKRLEEEEYNYINGLFK